MGGKCSSEFKIRNFGFNDCTASSFYTSQWSENKALFLAWRLFAFIFHLGWFVAGWVEGGEKYYLFFSNWSMLYSALYHGFAGSTVAYGIVCERAAKKRLKPPLTLENPVVMRRTDSKAKRDVGTETTEESCDESLKWFHKVTWVFHTLALDTVLLITFMYWSVVFPAESPELRNIHGIAKHSLNFALMLVDSFLIRTPVRYLHALYMVLSSLLYSGFLAIIYGVGLNSKVYGFTDFENAPARTVGILLSIALAGSWILHGAWFGLYHLRLYIHRECVRRVSIEPKTTQTKQG